MLSESLFLVSLTAELSVMEGVPGRGQVSVVLAGDKLARAIADDSSDWLFEWKADGFRALAYYKTFGNLRDTLAELKVTAILDGEIVCLDEEGRSLFMPLLARKAQASFYSFDLLWLGAKDLRGLPLVQRKQRLQRLVTKAKLPGVIYASHIEQQGIALYQQICQRDLEGIVCKRKDSIYSSKSRWLKVKNPDYTQAVGRREMFERFRG